MRLTLFLLSFLPAFLSASAQNERIAAFPQPDTVKVVQFMADLTVKEIMSRKEIETGIKTDLVKLALEAEANEREVVFRFPAGAKVVAKGMDVETEDDNELEWEYDWSLNETYRLLLAIASDSAENFTLYSGYIWLPKESKWKLIGTCRIDGRWGNIKEPAIFTTAKNKKQLRLVTTETGQAWLQRSNGSWKNLQGNITAPPVVIVTSHVDSILQHQKDIAFIQQAIASGKTDAVNRKDDVYYTLLKEGSGRPVSLTDTVVVHYKGYLLSDGTVFDQTKDRPATFPLNRLIRGWHIGVPLCNVGGKIKIVIPSALAYSIRTRSAKIPPNSILVFEVEVVDTKPTL